MITMSRVLCATDFSEGSRHAFDYAVAMAKWYRATLTVLHVHRLTMPVYAATPMAMPVGMPPILLTPAETAQLEQNLTSFVASASAPGLRVETLLDQDYDVAGAVLARAESVAADLLVLGTHGRSGFERFVLGSVAEKVLRRAAVPVLTVPPRAGAPGRPISMRPRILCAVDFSRSSFRSLDYAASLAAETDGVLVVLHVVEVPPESPDLALPDLAAYREARLEEGRLALARTVGALAEAWKVVPLVLAGPPHRVILQTAAEQNADLIVMGIQGRSAVERGLFGWTAERVVREATCPVLTLKVT
jgi:nucleotide-binding universal stress UspA family protein